MSRRHLVTRVSLALAAGLTVSVVAAHSHQHPDVVAVVALALLVAAGVGLLMDAGSESAAEWDPPRRPPATHGTDGVLGGHLRALTDHATSRRPDTTLRNRLRTAADGVLRTRHGVGVDSRAGRTLLGPDVVAVLDDGPRRLDVATVERVLDRIEAL